MTNSRVEARAALDQALRAYLQDRQWLERNSAQPETALEDGAPLLLLRDGDPELEDEPTMGVRTWPWRDPMALEIHASTDSATEAGGLVEAILREVEEALSDVHLGGAVDFLEVGQPEPVLTDEIGVSPLLAATIPIALFYTTDKASG